MFTYALYAFLAISAVALWQYGRDKRKARKKKNRVPESVLLGLGFFGGAAGALLGMSLFRHKTRHWYFWAANILGLAWQSWVLFFLL